MNFTIQQIDQLGSGIPWSFKQMERASVTVKALGENSFWVSKSKQAIFGIFLWSNNVQPNAQYPYQLRIMIYTPSDNYLADTKSYYGGVGIDGTINTTDFTYGLVGTMRDKNTIVWNDGDTWTRTALPAATSINQYNPAAVYQEAVQQSKNFNEIYNRAYPNAVRKLPW